MPSSLRIAAIWMLACFACLADEARLPGSWYQLPEDLPPTLAAYSETRVEPLSKAASSAIDLILSTHAKAWDKLAESDHYPLLSPSQADPMPWHLEFLGLDLGVSQQGAVGILFVQGAVLANLFWRRQCERHPQQSKTTRAANAAAPQGRSGNLTLVDWVEPDQLKRRIDPIVRSLLATGRIRNERALRKNLWEQAYQFDIMARVLSLQPPRAWVPSRLRLDLEVDGSGMVMPTLIAGGGIKLRFDWFPSSKRPSPVRVEWTRDPRDKQKAKSFEKFLGALARELRRVKLDPSTAPAQLPLTQVMLALGISLSGQFGIATVGAIFTGSLYLEQAPTTAYVQTVEESTEALSLIGGVPTPQQAAYAADHAIRMERGNGLSTVYRLPKDAFQKGLNKAYRMGSALAERAVKNQGRKWGVDELRVQYSLSLGGTVAVVTIAGTGSLQLIYQQSKQNRQSS